VTPVLGAAPVSLTVPIDGLPPTTVAGFKLNEDKMGGVIVNIAVLVTAL
jgi:hypothetical protein